MCRLSDSRVPARAGLVLAGLIGLGAEAAAQNTPGDVTGLPAVEVLAPQSRHAARKKQPPVGPRRMPRAPAAAGVGVAANSGSGASSHVPAPLTSSSEKYFSGEDVNARPFSRPAEALEVVPGLIVTQHSGDGKANQYFLRGFNLDHGTDFATSIIGMPVNMRSHAHGQGYTDLNWLIPELVDRLRYRKGPYFAEDGDFSS